MCRKLFYFISVAVLMLGGISSCENEPEMQPVPEWRWTESQEDFVDGVLSVGPDGGHFEIAYELEPVTDKMSVVTSGGADWMFTDGSMSGKILVAVMPNEGETAREAEFTVSVSGAAGMDPVPSVCVRQSAVVVEPEKDPSFEIKLQAVDDYLSAWFSITPVDKEMSYFVGIRTQSELEEDGLMKDDEALFKADMESRGSLSHAFRNAYKGDAFDVIFKFLYPNETYVLFVYGAEKEKGKAVRKTEVVRFAFDTREVDQVLTSFDHSYDMYGNLIRITVDPKFYDGLYYPTLKECKRSEDPEFLKYDMYSEWMNLLHHYISSGFSMEEIIEMHCCTGLFTSPLMEIEPDEKYFMTIVPVDAEGYLCSEIVVDVFESGSRIAPSPDNTFEIAVENITEEGAEVTVVPSMEKEPYAVAVLDVTKADLTDDQIEKDVEEKGFDFCSGEFKGSYSLLPDHEYVAVAFGYYSGARFTPVARKTFRTAAIELSSDIQVSSEQDSFYSCEEIEALDPEFEYDMWVDCVGFFKIIFDRPEEVDCYYLGFLGERYIYDKTVTDQEIIGKLKTGRKRYVSEGLNPGCYASFGDRMILAVVAVDKEGRMSQLHKCEYTFKKENRSPAEEFIERFGQQTSRALGPVFR